ELQDCPRAYPTSTGRLVNASARCNPERMADAILFGATALFGVAVGLFLAWKAYAERRDQRRWAPVDATIIACEVGSRAGYVEVNRVRRPATYFFPKVRYTYFFE